MQSCGTDKDVVVPDYKTEATTEKTAAENKEETENNEEVTEEMETLDDYKRFHKHAVWTELLQDHVSDKGWVDYKGMIKDSLKLNTYLMDLSTHEPDKSWTADEIKAFWINAYNAFTVKLIVDNYPVKSIKELGGSIYKVNTPWDIKFIHIGDETYDLNNIEHGILRKDYDESRVHAAVNCASVSCPKLLNEAYTSEDLEKQLNDQMIYFINDTDKNTVAQSKITISPIFKWFSGDFTKDGSIVDYINKYSEIEIDKSASVKYNDYDWNLNEQK